MRLKRWDQEYVDMPQFVKDGWFEWMSRNPDHPAHRDQLEINLACLALDDPPKGLEDRLMAARLHRPWQPRRDDCTDDEE